MIFRPEELAPRDIYKLLTATVVPRPIALVTSVNREGVVNAAPFSFFNMLGSDPPIVALGVGNRSEGTPKDTALNIEAQQEFVVNLVSEEIASAMNICATDFPHGLSEIEAAQLKLAESDVVAVPRIKQSPVNLECRLNQILEIGRNRIILGEVVALHIEDEFVDTEKMYVASGDLKLIGRMGGAGGYVRTSDRFEIDRISYNEWLQANTSE